MEKNLLEAGGGLVLGSSTALCPRWVPCPKAPSLVSPHLFGESPSLPGTASWRYWSIPWLPSGQLGHTRVRVEICSPKHVPPTCGVNVLILGSAAERCSPTPGQSTQRWGPTPGQLQWWGLASPPWLFWKEWRRSGAARTNVKGSVYLEHI